MIVFVTSRLLWSPILHGRLTCLLTRNTQQSVWDYIFSPSDRCLPSGCQLVSMPVWLELQIQIINNIKYSRISNLFNLIHGVQNHLETKSHWLFYLSAVCVYVEPTGSQPTSPCSLWTRLLRMMLSMLSGPKNSSIMWYIPVLWKPLNYFYSNSLKEAI